jgi:hypothetical protein
MKQMQLLIVGMAALAGSAALAQEEGLAVSAGVRAWATEWTTFSYYTERVGNVDVNRALTQVSAGTETVLVPTLNLRYRDFIAAASLFPRTTFRFANGDVGTRQEADLNLGYSFWPGLTGTLGYKRISQRGGPYRYEPAGLVVGLSGNAALSGGLSLYGSVGVGRLRTPRANGNPHIVEFDTIYRLTEVGLSYSQAADRWLQRWTLIGGYRIQVMSSREAFGTQDGRDTTQGLTLGLLGTF